MIEKIIQRLQAEAEEHKKYWNKFDDEDSFGGMNATLRAIKIVQEVAKEYGNGWIPCSERLPEPYQRVLVYDAWDDSITIEHLQENDSFIDSVVAWMPLPIAPYQKGE